MRRFSGNFVSLVIALAVSFGCAAKDVENDKVVLTDLHLESLPGGIYAITGLGRNKSDKVITTNFVKFNLLQNGIITDSTIDTASGIKPNQQWKVFAPVNIINGKPDEFEAIDILSR
ncbi:FxLYD domain-containing protein [Citrobacter koseri]|uniref:FxLYD domain-containing protein n=1 Tax=Citrobacter koseri TaxID=545 RepID=UPI003D08C61B